MKDRLKVLQENYDWLILNLFLKILKLFQFKKIF